MPQVFDTLAEAFQVATGYMPSNSQADPYTSSVQWSRRFTGLRLRLFLALASVGWDGYRQHIEHTLAMGDLLRENMTDQGWRVVNASPVGVIGLFPRNRIWFAVSFHKS